MKTPIDIGAAAYRWANSAVKPVAAAGIVAALALAPVARGCWVGPALRGCAGLHESAVLAVAAHHCVRGAVTIEFSGPLPVGHAVFAQTGRFFVAGAGRARAGFAAITAGSLWHHDQLGACARRAAGLADTR